MKVAYLANQYPKTSHTFIRREIAGVEEAGLEVERISVRAVDEALVDEADRAECARTRVLLARGTLGLLPSALAVLVSRPLRTWRALRTAVAMGRSSPRGISRHLAYLAEACVLLRWSARSGVEHVHAHFCTNPAAVALLCNELGGPPFSFTAHSSTDLDSAAKSLPRKMEKASFAVAVSEDGRSKLLRLTPGHEHKVRVVRCGIDLRFFAAEPAPRERGNGVPAAPRFLCVARLSPEKGIDVLLRAFHRLAQAGLDCELVLVGDGSERERLEALARDLDLADRVRFEGWKSGAEVRALMLDSRVFVLASRSEGLPIVIMEAMALRRPVIATTVGGIAELVLPGASGWLVPPGNERSLAEAMRAALACPAAELAALGRRGAERVARLHDASVQARSLVQLFLDSRARLSGWSAAGSTSGSSARTADGIPTTR